MFIFFGYPYSFAIWTKLSLCLNEFRYYASTHKNLTHSCNPTEAKSAAGNLSVASERKIVLKNIELPK